MTGQDVNAISVHQEGEYTLLRMPSQLWQEFSNDFLNSPKAQQIVTDGPQSLRQIVETVKQKAQQAQGQTQTAGSGGRTSS